MTVRIRRVLRRRACRRMVDLLALAHDQCCEARLADEIDRCLATGELPDPAVLGKRFAPKPPSIPHVGVALPPMSEYDDACLNGALA